MRLAVCAALLLCGCRLSLESGEGGDDDGGGSCKTTTTAVCVEAVNHSDFAWIESKIFLANCFGSSCHTGTTASGKRDLSAGQSYATLMGAAGTGGVKSNIDMTRDLVVPGSPAKSYLYYIMHAIQPEEADPPASAPPGDVGYMPMNNAILCCQKLDAVERWITGGALNN